MGEFERKHKIINDQEYKYCIDCKNWKLLNSDNFYKHILTKDGFLNVCKDCSKAYAKNKYTKRKTDQSLYKDKTIICSLGGGFTSSALMPRTLLKIFPKSQIEFVNCVLPNEHADMWKLFDAVENKLNIKINHIAYDPKTKYQIVAKEDRNNRDKLYTPFDLFLKQGFIANSRNDPCSRLLKRETIFNYVSQKYSPDECVVAVGIHKDEFERSIAIRENWEEKGYKTYFPLLKSESISKKEQIRLLKKWYGVSIDLYEKGFEHNNCGGACVKAGQRQWGMLWFYYPDVFSEWEQLEQKWNIQWSEIRGKEYSILKIARNKKTQYISLKDFREQILEPAYMNGENGFMGKFLQGLPGNPACMWCSAI